MRFLPWGPANHPCELADRRVQPPTRKNRAGGIVQHMRNERLWGMDGQLSARSTARAFREETAAAFRTGVAKLIFFRWNARKISRLVRAEATWPPGLRDAGVGGIFFRRHAGLCNAGADAVHHFWRRHQPWLLSGFAAQQTTMQRQWFGMAVRSQRQRLQLSAGCQS